MAGFECGIGMIQSTQRAMCWLWLPDISRMLLPQICAAEAKFQINTYGWPDCRRCQKVHVIGCNGMDHVHVEIAMLQRDHLRVILRKARNIYRLSQDTEKYCVKDWFIKNKP